MEDCICSDEDRQLVIADGFVNLVELPVHAVGIIRWGWDHKPIFEQGFNLGIRKFYAIQIDHLVYVQRQCVPSRVDCRQ